MLAPAERDFFTGARALPALTVAAGLCRPASARPRELWIPRSEGGPLERAVFEPGLPAGRVPGGRGRVWLRARQDFTEARADAPDDAVAKELLDALDRICPGTLRTVDFHEVFRSERATPRFDVGAYRALARFDAVQDDLRAQGRRVYFAGDTGYFHGFAAFGEEFGPIDVAMLPIGAYAPRWFMGFQHMDPQQAYRAFLDLRARFMLPMHWGTFDLTDEPVDHPPQELAEVLAAAGGDARVRTLAIGERWRVPERTLAAR